jgi:hypothetical protein
VRKAALLDEAMDDSFAEKLPEPHPWDLQVESPENKRTVRMRYSNLFWYKGWLVGSAFGHSRGLSMELSGSQCHYCSSTRWTLFESFVNIVGAQTDLRGFGFSFRETDNLPMATLDSTNTF